MSFLDRLDASGGLPEYFNLRKRSLIGLHGTVLTVVGTPTWTTTRKGPGVYCQNAGGNDLSAGNAVSLQLGTGTIFAVAARNESNLGNFQGITAKINSYGMYFNSGAEPKAFGIYDYGGGAWRASTFTEGPTGLLHLFAMSFQSGVVNGTSFFVDGQGKGLTTFTVLNQASSLLLGIGSANQGIGGSIILAGISNRIWTPAEHAELWSDFLDEGFVGGLQKRNIQYSYPSKNAAEYAAAGIVLDTDGVSEYPGGVRRIRDLTGNYYGTPGTIIIPGQDGEGMTIGSTGLVDWLNVSQLNSASQFALEWMQELPRGNIPNNHFLQKRLDDNNMLRVSVNAAAADPQKILCFVNNGGNTYAQSTNPVLRSGVRQHILWSFNGLGATNPDKLQLTVDGDDVPLTFTGVLPASLANMGANIYTFPGINVSNPVPGTYYGHRVRTGVTLSQAQRRAIYLKSLAQRLDLRVTLEDTPVSLVASVAAPGQIGDWQLFDGSWKCGENASAQRSLDNVVAGTACLSSDFKTGTWLCYFETSGPQIEIGFMSSVRGRFLATGQNGYNLVVTAAGDLRLNRITAGAIGAILFRTANGYIAPNTRYALAWSRRPSDGLFTVWIKGGAYISWTLVVAGVSGTNPVADATYFTSEFFHFFGNAAGKLHG